MRDLFSMTGPPFYRLSHVVDQIKGEQRNVRLLNLFGPLICSGAVVVLATSLGLHNLQNNTVHA